MANEPTIVIRTNNSPAKLGLTETGAAVERLKGRAVAAGRQISSTFGGIKNSVLSLNGAIAALGLGVGARQIIKTADNYKNLEGRLKLVTGSAEELAEVQKELFDISQATRVEQTGTIDLYTRIARSTKEMNVSSKERLELTEAINKALIISGASTVEASNAVRQLGQSFSGGMQAQEFNSIIDQTPRLIQAIADGLGMTTAQFRSFVKEGKATGEVLFTALQKSSGILDAEFKQMGKTVEQSMSVLNNSIGKVISQTDSAGSATEVLAGEIIKLSQEIDIWAEANKGIMAQEMPGHIDSIKDSVSGLFNFFKGLPDGTPKALLLTVLTGKLVGGAPGRVAAGIAGGASFLSSTRKNNGMYSNTWNQVDAPFNPDDWIDNANGALLNVKNLENPQILNLIAAKAKRKAGGTSEATPTTYGTDSEKDFFANNLLLKEIESYQADMMNIRQKNLADMEKTAQEYRDKVLTPFEKMEKDLSVLDLYEKMLNPDEFVRAQEIILAEYETATEKLKECTEETSTEMSEFWQSAFGNMENAASSFFYDVMQGNFDNLLDGFFDMTQKMVAEWMAAQAMMALVGDAGSGGKLGGLLGAVVNGASAAYGAPSGGGAYVADTARMSSFYSMKYDTGGWINEPVFGVGSRSGKGYAIAENGPELVSNPRRGQAGGGNNAPQPINLTIIAADSKSIYDMMKRNPQAILGPLTEAIQKGDTGTINTLRSIM